MKFLSPGQASVQFILVAHFIFLCIPSLGAATVVVAAANTPAPAKAKADLVCQGTNDQAVLLESLTRAPTVSVLVDGSPSHQDEVTCIGTHSVEWLPGDYYLTDTLILPAAADMVIHAEGARFHYSRPTGDAVVVRGMMRCRYYFGAIYTGSDGVALHIRPTRQMQCLMSFVSFTGLCGKNQKGIGLFLDAAEQGVCVNRFEGTDIAGFETGVFVDDAATKVDTNWLWFNYIRLCRTCIWEKGKKVDDNVWDVNVDASLPNSVAIRTAATYGKWHVVMGTFAGKDKGAKALILDPGATDNTIEMHPPIEQFAWEDNSGTQGNVILSGANRKPH